MNQPRYAPLFYALLLASLLLQACSTVPAIIQAEKLPSAQQCWQQTPVTFGTTNTLISTSLNHKIDAYKLLVEESLTHRAIGFSIINQLQEEGKLSSNVPLAGSDLDSLNGSLMAHLTLRTKLYEVAYAQSCWHKPKKDTYEQLNMQPLTDLNQLKGTMLSISATLVLYDNYLILSSLFEEHKKLRNFLNQKDPAYAKGNNALEKLAKSYHSDKKLHMVKRVIRFYEQHLKTASSALVQDENFIYLNTLIQQSPSYNAMKKNAPLKRLGKRLGFVGTVANDEFRDLRSGGLNLFSGILGNATGLIESRKGKLYHKDDVLKKVSHQLSAGDILLEKTPFRLTDKMIPGHWGHAAIWVGTEEELKALGIWNHPVVLPYHDKIRKGAAVVEALRSGVQVNSIAHFLNVDDLAILRSTNTAKGIKIKHILLALKQVGKDYDFNFDVETTDKIVCSELVYTVYTDMNWPTEKALGRYTISPDNVANKTMDGSLELVMLYHDGEEITTQQVSFMEQLIVK